jgi:Zn-dependent metalloprotease
MKAPGTAYDNKVLGKDPQPADMQHYVHTAQDNGGVHINLGIPNHAFYLAATALGGNAWVKAGQIWYDTIHDRNLRPTATFAAFAGALWPMPNGGTAPPAPSRTPSRTPGTKSA